MFRRRVSEANTGAAVPDRGRHAGRAGPAASPAGRASPATPARPGGPAAGAGPPHSAQPIRPPPAGLDPSTPHPARAWDYWARGPALVRPDHGAGEAVA